MLQAAAKKRKVQRFSAIKLQDPERFGVVEFDNKQTVLSIEEKQDSKIAFLL